jgi:adenosylmethionine-8-amino-7-oxononanoate aminotransferase
MSNWSRRDRSAIWHPFTHQWKEQLPITILKGEGCYLFDDEGRSYLDAISSWWVNLHGHAHPYIAQKMHEQLLTLEHVIFAGFTHPPAIELAERLLQILPPNQEKIFFSDNGSTAVEVAIKMVRQYWWNIGQPRHTFFALEGSYHGDTFGAMAVGQPNYFNVAFDPPAFRVIHLPRPNANNIESVLNKMLDWAKSGDIAGFIFEPLVQGAGGMLMYREEYLDQMISLCRELNIFTIADEVMTGFGRTGAFFACDYLDAAPDIMCLSKGLTGGYLPMGITTCTSQIYDAFLEKDIAKTFYHGHSYTGNPLSCAAALASLDLLSEQSCIDKVVRIVYQHADFKEYISQHSAIENIRQCGTILAMDVKSEAPTNYFNSLSDTLTAAFLKRGVLLRPLGNTLYIMPPYCITRDELQIVYSVIEEVLDGPII